MPISTLYRELTFQEATAVFDIVEQTRQTREPEDLVTEIRQVAGRIHDRRNVRQLQLLAIELMMRESAGLSLLLTLGERDDLANRIKYGVSVSWVRDKTFWFQQWRKRQREDARRGRARTPRILAQIWVPETNAIPIDLLAGSHGFHAAEIGGRILRWQEETRTETCGSKERKRWTVVRCWLDQSDDQWLVSDLFARLSTLAQDQIAERYERLQTEGSAFLAEAAAYRRETARGLVNISTAEVDAARLGGGLGRITPEIDRAIYLLDEPRRLREQIIMFSDSVDRTVEDWGDVWPPVSSRPPGRQS